MNISDIIMRLRCRKLWSDSQRKIQTLESFSQTEFDAGENIKNVLQFIQNPHLRTHLKRHADDELRHGELFWARAQELRGLQPGTDSISNRPDKLYSLSGEHSHSEFNSHGFFRTDLFENHGEIMYVAMLYMAEKRAEKSFVIHSQLNISDAVTHNIFEAILKDERYHVSYTGKFLRNWESEGKADEVKKAISYAKRAQFTDAAMRILPRFGERIGHAILYVIYYTLVMPFAFLSKLSKPKSGWVVNQTKSDIDLHSQY